MTMELQVAGAKVSKYAVSESGDTLEMIERPHGGLSFVLVDGQHTGRGAKAVSNLVARKAVSLLGEGVRDGSAARAAHDYLFMQHNGKVSAELVIVSIDLVSKSIVVSRNSHCPVIIAKSCEMELFSEASEPIGFHRWMKPQIKEMPISSDMTVIAFTDGVLDAGIRYGDRFDPVSFVKGKLGTESISAQSLADAILEQAVHHDQGRPNDDTSVLVIRVLTHAGLDGARRISVRFPID